MYVHSYVALVAFIKENIVDTILSTFCVSNVLGCDHVSTIDSRKFRRIFTTLIFVWPND